MERIRISEFSVSLWLNVVKGVYMVEHGRTHGGTRADTWVNVAGSMVKRDRLQGEPEKAKNWCDLLDGGNEKDG